MKLVKQELQFVVLPTHAVQLAAHLLQTFLPLLTEPAGQVIMLTHLLVIESQNYVFGRQAHDPVVSVYEGMQEVQNPLPAAVHAEQLGAQAVIRFNPLLKKPVGGGKIGTQVLLTEAR